MSFSLSNWHGHHTLTIAIVHVGSCKETGTWDHKNRFTSKESSKTCYSRQPPPTDCAVIQVLQTHTNGPACLELACETNLLFSWPSLQLGRAPMLHSCCRSGLSMICGSTTTLALCMPHSGQQRLFQPFAWILHSTCTCRGPLTVWQVRCLHGDACQQDMRHLWMLNGLMHLQACSELWQH